MRLFETILTVSFCFAVCSCSSNRDEISFNVPVEVMEDSIKVMNTLLRPYKEFDYYLDDAKVLYLANHKVAKIDSSFFAQIKLGTSKYTDHDKRFFSIVLFLKANEINSCFTYKQLGVIVYDFKPTKEDRFKDVRYIILNDNQIDIKSMWFKESFKILDKKDDLLLIAPIDFRK